MDGNRQYPIGIHFLDRIVIGAAAPGGLAGADEPDGVVAETEEVDIRDSKDIEIYLSFKNSVFYEKLNFRFYPNRKWISFRDELLGSTIFEDK